MSFGNVVGGLLFSGIGLVALRYGKKQGRPRAMVLGGALLVYPYFVSNPFLMWGVGVLLTGGLFLPGD